jgi:hypothetical protein
MILRSSDERNDIVSYISRLLTKYKTTFPNLQATPKYLPHGVKSKADVDWSITWLEFYSNNFTPLDIDHLLTF